MTHALYSWDEPAELAARGTVFVLPGRGEHGGVYERLGRRLAFDAYRVRALDDAADAAGSLPGLLADAGPGPRVLLGADTGARRAIALAADREVAVDALVLAGLPTGRNTAPAATDWEAELDLRTACPTHRGRLTADPAFRRGALVDGPLDPPPALDRVTVPVLALHGADDTVSPLADARRVYSGIPGVHLVGLAGTRHDVLNDVTHRTAAATLVLFLERLRLSPDVPPIAIPESGDRHGVAA
ncbi:alpha/beta hydrolase [Streptomyces mayteni]